MSWRYVDELGLMSSREKSETVGSFSSGLFGHARNSRQAAARDNLNSEESPLIERAGAVFATISVNN